MLFPKGTPNFCRNNTTRIHYKTASGVTLMTGNMGCSVLSVRHILGRQPYERKSLNAQRNFFYHVVRCILKVGSTSLPTITHTHILRHSIPSYGLDERGVDVPELIESRFSFFTSSRPTLGPTPPHTQRVPATRSAG
jgi:hypothetical protein